MAAHVDCDAYAPVTPGFWLVAPSENQISGRKKKQGHSLPPCQPWFHFQSADQRLLPALLYLIGSLVVIRPACQTLEFLLLVWISTVLSGFLIEQAMWLFLTHGWTVKNQQSFISFVRNDWQHFRETVPPDPREKAKEHRPEPRKLSRLTAWARYKLGFLELFATAGSSHFSGQIQRPQLWTSANSGFVERSALLSDLDIYFLQRL